MQLFFPTVALLSDMLPGALGVAVAVVVSFVVITLVSSYYRFQHIVQQAENTQPEEMGATAIDILRVQLARYLAGCARRGTSFSISLIQLNDSSLEVHMGFPVIAAIKEAARCNDIVCVYDQHTAALLMEAEPEDSEAILGRIIDTVSGRLAASGGELLRVGIASYPGHGLSGKNLLEVASEGLALSNADRPIVLPEIVDEDGEMPEEASETPDEESRVEGESVAETESKSRRQRRKRGMLDELTGVLKPSAVSAYMQRMMSD